MIVDVEKIIAEIEGTHEKALACPMSADQEACHDIKGFTDKCNELNGGWLSQISRCVNQSEKAECWERFNNLTPPPY